MTLPELALFLGSHPSSSARIAAVEDALNSPSGPKIRAELGNWVIRFLPAEKVVPEVYAAWRPLVRDSMLFMIAHLSARRLAPKLVEQLDLPPDTTPWERLLRLIAKVPGLQKIGQVLAHNRHLDPAMRDALSELENGIHDVTAAEIGALVRRQLGRSLKIYRVELEPQLLAEASVSAVMRFTWQDAVGSRRQRGVFKVLKPLVAACFAEDIELLQQLAQELAATHAEYGRALPETIMEVRRLLEHEVDFAREQSTLLEVARAYRRVRGVRVPRLIAPLSNRSITALSEESGVKITAALAEATGAQRRRAAGQLIEALIAAPLFARGDHAIYHADPHAGNLLYSPETGELVVLDWALVENLGRAQRKHVAMLALMMVLRDPAGVCAEIQALSFGHRLDPAQRAFVHDCVDDFIGGLPLSRLPGSIDAMRLLDRLALEGIRFPSGLMMLRKVWFTLDGILHDIAPPGFRVDLALARHFLGNSPLSLLDWIEVEASALLLGGRLWVQWAQAALSRASG